MRSKRDILIAVANGREADAAYQFIEVLIDIRDLLAQLANPLHPFADPRAPKPTYVPAAVPKRRCGCDSAYLRGGPPPHDVCPPSAFWPVVLSAPEDAQDDWGFPADRGDADTVVEPV